MRRSSAAGFILVSMLIVALVLPAAPAMAQSATVDCDKTWTPNPATWDYSADTPTNWSPEGIPVATDIVCLPATPDGNYIYSGTITEPDRVLRRLD